MNSIDMLEARINVYERETISLGAKRLAVCGSALALIMQCNIWGYSTNNLFLLVLSALFFATTLFFYCYFIIINKLAKIKFSIRLTEEIILALVILGGILTSIFFTKQIYDGDRFVGVENEHIELWIIDILVILFMGISIGVHTQKHVWKRVF